MPALFGHHRGELGRRALGGDLLEPGQGPSALDRVAAEDDHFRDDPAAAALLPAVSVGLGHRLPRGDHDQEPPEVVAIGELRKLAPRRPVAKAVEGAQGGVFLVFVGPRRSQPFELGPGHRDQLGEIPLPERLRRRLVAFSQLAEPAGYRVTLIDRHRHPRLVLPALPAHPRPP